MSGPEAIYEEPRVSSTGAGRPRRPPSIRPPPLPEARPHTATLETVVSHTTDDSDYELCPTPTPDARATAAAVAVAAAARAGVLASQRTNTLETVVCGEEVQRDSEYSVPFAGPAGGVSPQLNSSLDRPPVDGRTVSRHARAVSCVSEGPYALPYDPKSDQVADDRRRSIPDVAVPATERECGESAG